MGKAKDGVVPVNVRRVGGPMTYDKNVDVANASQWHGSLTMFYTALGAALTPHLFRGPQC